VYEEPADAFVADFLGVSNLMWAQASGANGSGRCRVRIGDFDLEAGRGETSATGEVRVTIRPERVRLAPSGETGENRLPGMVDRAVYLGSTTQLIVRLAHGDTVQAMIPNDGGGTPYEQGTPVTVMLPADALRVLTKGEVPATEPAGAAEPA
jgi:spermidine/putrescine transport system ATP-binding protein